jgi:hypothetical protein
MGAKLLNTKERKCWHGITIVAAGEIVGRIETLTLTDGAELDRIAEIIGAPARFSMGCAVAKAECAICGKDYGDDEDSEHGR